MKILHDPRFLDKFFAKKLEKSKTRPGVQTTDLQTMIQTRASNRVIFSGLGSGDFWVQNLQIRVRVKGSVTNYQKWHNILLNLKDFSLKHILLWNF